MSDNVVPANTDTCLVEFDKKEYAIVGDALFANTVEEVPQWFQNLIQDKVLQVNGPMYDMLTQYNLSLLAALQGLDIAKNTYEQYIYKLATDSEAYVASLTTLNSTIAGNDASIRQLLTTYTNELGLAISTVASILNSKVDDSNSAIYNIQTTYATQDYVAAAAEQLLTASLNGGAIGARISSAESAMATQYGAMAQRLNVLEAEYTDSISDLYGKSQAIEALEAYVGRNNDGSTSSLSYRVSKLTSYLTDASTGELFGGVEQNLGGYTEVIAKNAADVAVADIYSKYSKITVGGKEYINGFGLFANYNGTTGGSSTFWAAADQFKLYDASTLNASKIQTRTVFTKDGNPIEVVTGITGGVTPFKIENGVTYLQNAVIGWGDVAGAGKPQDGATRNVNRGTWASGVAYVVGDIVQYNGSSYTNKIATSSVDPTNTSYWTLLASQGINGLNKAVVNIYYKNTSSSVAPTASITGPFTYTFSTNVLSGGVLNGWTTTLPTAGNGEYVWVRQATASSSTNTDTIDAVEFSGAVCLSGVGVNGLNTATVYLYAVNTSNTTAPSAFSGTFTYTFATGKLSGGVLNGWVQSVPTIPKGSYLWVRQATATSNGTTDSISSSEFSSAVVISGVGNDGGKGDRGAFSLALDVATTSTTYTSSTSITASRLQGQTTWTGIGNGSLDTFSEAAAYWTMNVTGSSVPVQGDSFSVNVYNAYTDTAPRKTIQWVYSGGSWVWNLALLVHGDAIVKGSLELQSLRSSDETTYTYPNGTTYKTQFGINNNSGKYVFGLYVYRSDQTAIFGASGDKVGVAGSSLFDSGGSFSSGGKVVRVANPTEALSATGYYTNGTLFSSNYVITGYGRPAFFNSSFTMAKHVYLATEEYSLQASHAIYAPQGVLPFTGSHIGLYNNLQELPAVGDLVFDDDIGIRLDISNTLTVVGITYEVNCKSVVGVFHEVSSTPKSLMLEGDPSKNIEAVVDPFYTDYLKGFTFVTFNSVGEGQVNVCGLGGNLEPGDLITSSSIPGKGMKQADDVVRNYTVGKCREYVTFDYPEQVKQVACIYMCG